MKVLAPIVAVLSGALLALSSCSGSGSGSGSDAGSNPGGSSSTSRFTNVVVGTVGDAELFALDTQWAGLRLVSESGQLTQNLLLQDTSVELVGLADQNRWLAQGQVPVDTYVELELSFASRQVRAVDDSGQVILGQADSDTLRLPFAQPLLLDGPVGEVVQLDIDLTSSIDEDSDSTPAAGFDFLLDGLVVLGGNAPMAEVLGTVLSLDASGSGLLMQANSLDGLQLGDLQVDWQSSSMLFDVDGSVFPDPAAFRSSLTTGQSLICVQGSMGPDGHLIADRMEVLDELDVNPTSTLEAEGKILRSDLEEGSFSLLLRNIFGVDTALGLPNGGFQAGDVLDFTFDSSLRLLNPDGTFTDLEDLERGRLVQVRFSAFDLEPYAAQRVRLLTPDLCLKGTIVSTDSAAQELTLQLKSDPFGDCDDDDYEDDYGRDDDDDCDDGGLLIVDISGSSILLDLSGRPSLRADQLSPGQSIKLCGTLGGTRANPTLTATGIRVKPGHLIKGQVSRLDMGAASFELSAGKIVKTFGERVSGAPLEVFLQRETRYVSKAKSEAEFYRLFNGLEDDEYLDVKLKGVAGPRPETIDAFEVKSKVRRRQ